MKTTAGKAKVAAIGSVLSVATAVITALSDGEMTSTELQGVIGLAVVAVGTVYSVWKKKNYVVNPPSNSEDQLPL